MEFGIPHMLWGAAAISVPIIIHLINRRKFKRVVWAAMRFVQLSIDQNQRRMRLEDWILLLLRCAMLLLLALALAKPTLTDSTAMGDAPVAAVIVLDNSLSMGTVEGNKTRFDQAKEACREILKSLPDSSKSALFLASGVVQQKVNKPRKLEDVSDELTKATLSDHGTSLYPALSQAIDTLVQGRILESNKEVYVVTDATAHGWRQSKQIRDLLEENKDEVKVHFIVVGGDKVGGPAPANLSIASLKAADDMAITVGRENRFFIDVANHSENNQTNVRVRLRYGESETQVAETILPAVPANGKETITLKARFDAPGLHQVTANVNGGEVNGVAAFDPLAADNERTVVVSAIQVASVLLVNGGENADDPFRDDASVLEEALEPHKDGQDFYVQAEVRGADRLQDVDLSQYEIVVLANVGSLEAGFVDALAQFVSEGNGLVVFPGANLEDAGSLEFYNTQLHGKLGLLPAAYGPAVGNPDRLDSYTTLNTANLTHGVLRVWRDLGGSELEDLREGVRFYRRQPMAVPREISATLLEEVDGIWKVQGEADPFDGWVVHREAAADSPQTVRYLKGKPMVATRYESLEGETLQRIAQLNGITASRLRDVNPSIDWDNLSAGTQVTIPAPPRAGLPQVVLRYAGTSHRVRADETLEEIAAIYDVDAADIRAANPTVENWTDLDADQLVIVPGDDPAVIEAEWGQGRVYQFSSTSDVEWCNLPLQPHMVTLMHPILGSLLQKKVTSLNVPVGAPLKRTLGGGVGRGLQAAVVKPGDSEEQEQVANVQPADGIFTFQFADTHRAGVYQVSFKYDETADTKADPPAPLTFAVQPDARESDIEPMQASAQDQLGGQATAHDWPKDNLGAGLSQNRSGTPFWLPFLILALLFTAMEILAAQRFSRPK